MNYTTRRTRPLVHGHYGQFLAGRYAAFRDYYMAKARMLAASKSPVDAIFLRLQVSMAREAHRDYLRALQS